MRRKICQNIRFSEDEWKAVKRRAKKVKQKPAVFIRNMAVLGQIKVYDFEKYMDLKFPFFSIGNNINQIAKVANSTHSIYTKDIEELRAEVSRLEDIFENCFSELEYNTYE